MIRLIIVLVFFVSLLFSQGSTDKKIKNTSYKLNSYSRNYANINRKMAVTAREILKQKHSLIKQSRYLKALKIELELKEHSYKKDAQELKLMKSSQKDLKAKQNDIEEKLVFVIAKSVSLSVVLDEKYAQDETSVMEFEVLKTMLKKSKNQVKILSIKFVKNVEKITSLDKHAKKLEVAITSIDKKRKNVLKIQEANKKAIKKLVSARKSYKEKLKTLLKRQNLLKRTLSKLNLIKIDEIKKKKEEKERKKAFQNKKNLLNETLPKVKKHGSSYQAVRTKKYKGKKTIAPLDSYIITKKYGTYIDPIYGIKIFNESISLKPKEPNAKVKTVFNGKVIYADKTAVLKNIVIIEHKNGLHTIYANLSQISPNIKKGIKIKKGYTIGRVKNELIFEVTQKSYHINPIRLFRHN